MKSIRSKFHAALSLSCAALASLSSTRAEVAAPESVPAGSPFEAQWTGAETAGRLRVLNEAGEAFAGASYGYLKDKKATLTAPARPGRYGLGFQPGTGEIIGVRPLEVTPVEATLTAPAAVEINAAITVGWTGPAYRTDRVRIMAADGTPLRAGSYGYPANNPDGSLQLKAPIEPGDYLIAYEMGGELLAKRPLRVGGTEASVAAPESVQAGGEFAVRWTGPDNRGDYVSIIPAGTEARPTSSDYTYTANSTANAVTLTAPEKLGAYEVVYFTGGKVLARQPIEVGAVTATLDAPAEVVGTLSFEVAWTGPGNNQDRVLMTAPGAEAGVPPAAASYVVRGEPTVAVQAPAEPGGYVLRYVTRAGKVLAERPITVTPPPAEPGFLNVTSDPGRTLGPGSAVEVILDASGSMLQRQGGERRIEIAKATLLGLVGEVIPEGTGFALRVFGHREAGSCRTDLEIPLGPLDPSAAKAKIAGVQAMNLAKTPIAASLGKVGGDLAAATGERVVILITDGEETCDGDPALAIRLLRSEGSDVRVNIVGYSIDDEALRETFAGWAALGGGQYLDAPDASELARAVRGALAVPFEVYSGDTFVAEGVTGAHSIPLPVGTYQIRYRRAGEAKAVDVELVSKETAVVELD